LDTVIGFPAPNEAVALRAEITTFEAWEVEGEGSSSSLQGGKGRE
jgi:hypothetical protein